MPPDQQDAARQADLDAGNYIAILLDGLDRELHVGQTRIDEFAKGVVRRPGRLPDHRNVQQRIDACFHDLDNVLAETRERVRCSTSGVERGGDALGDAVRAGGNAKRRNAVIDMSVDVARGLLARTKGMMSTNLPRLQTRMGTP